MKESEELVYVALGANLGDREESFVRAIEAIEKDSDLALLCASAVFETEPVGPPGQDSYLNAVVELRVRLDPFELLQRLHAIERAMGRDRGTETERWGPRTLDLDILFFGDREIDTPALVIPHARAHERNFVMAPLAEIAPELVHPRLKISMTALARVLPALGRPYVWSDPTRWPSHGRCLRTGH